MISLWNSMLDLRRRFISTSIRVTGRKLGAFGLLQIDPQDRTFAAQLQAPTRRVPRRACYFGRM
jgi:hypothetical protein